MNILNKTENEFDLIGCTIHELKQKLRQGTMAVMTVLSTLAPNAIGIAGAGAVAMNLQSCKTGAEPAPINNELTLEEQKFADLFKLRKDGSIPSFTVDIGDPADPYFMPKLFKMEMKLVSAKYGTYEITPIISKKPIEEGLLKAELSEPGKKIYVANLAFVIRRADGSNYSPTSTQSIIREDDNDPATNQPYLAQLPETFTMDIFKQFNPNALPTRSYTLNKGEELQLWVELETFGEKFMTVKLPTKPVELLSVANLINK